MALSYTCNHHSRILFNWSCFFFRWRSQGGGCKSTFRIVWFLIKSLCSSLLVPCDAGHLLDKIMLCGAVFIWISRKSFFHQQPNQHFLSIIEVCLFGWILLWSWEAYNLVIAQESLADSIAPPAPHAQYVTLQHDYSHSISYLFFRILPIKHWHC